MRLTVSLKHGGLLNHKNVTTHFVEGEQLTIHAAEFYARIPLDLITRFNARKEDGTEPDKNPEGEDESAPKTEQKQTDFDKDMKTAEQATNLMMKKKRLSESDPNNPFIDKVKETMKKKRVRKN